MSLWSLQNKFLDIFIHEEYTRTIWMVISDDEIMDDFLFFVLFFISISFYTFLPLVLY